MKRLLVTSVLLAVIVFSAYSQGDGEGDAGLGDITLEGYSRATDENMGFDFQWKVEGEELHVQMAAVTTGWIALGFDPTKMMAGANIIIGYVSDGSVFLSDDYGSGQVKHSPDEELGGEEHLSRIDGEEENGATRIRFTIPLNSGDSYDKPLVPGNTYKVIYAYGPNGSDDFGSYHSRKRGSFEITL